MQASFGLDVVKDSKLIRRRLGYVPSEASLYDKMKVYEFLKFGADFYGGKQTGDRIRELAGLLDLDLERNIPELSTGNKKKVNIIQSLIHRPDLLILDEPTTAGSFDTNPGCSAFFRMKTREGPQYSSLPMYPSEVQSLCPKVAIVRDGRITRS